MWDWDRDCSPFYEGAWPWSGGLGCGQPWPSGLPCTSAQPPPSGQSSCTPHLNKSTKHITFFAWTNQWIISLKLPEQINLSYCFYLPEQSTNHITILFDFKIKWSTIQHKTMWCDGVFFFKQIHCTWQKLRRTKNDGWLGGFVWFFFSNLYDKTGSTLRKKNKLT